MAATQAAPAPPPMMSAALPPLPPNLTQDKVREIQDRYKRLKANNVPETDAEYVEVVGLMRRLTAHNRQTQAVRAQLLARQQQAQGAGQAARDGTNNAALPNSAQNGAVTSTEGTPQSLPSQTNGPVQKQSALPAGFTPALMAQLRTQVLIFKSLSKGQVIPPGLQQQLAAFKHAKQEAPPPVETQQPDPQLAAPTNIARSSPTAAARSKPTLEGKPLATLPQARSKFETFKSPYEKLKKHDENGRINFWEHQQRGNRPLIPAIMPSSVEVDLVRLTREDEISLQQAERKLDLGRQLGWHRTVPATVDEDRERFDREVILFNRIEARKQELASLPADFGLWETMKNDFPTQEHDARMRAIIEYRKLTLLPKQQALRREVAKHLIQFDNVAQTANRSQCRRAKRRHGGDGERQTEKLEKLQRDARENKEKKQQIDRLNAILAQVKNNRTDAPNAKVRMHRMGGMHLQMHQNIEREEQKRLERTAKERLKALKNDDEATYLKLLGQAKDSRISHLLKQTDGFLNQLAASVREQQRNSADRYGDLIAPSDDEDEESDEEGGAPKVDYYEVAHRIKEEVKEQAHMLVGGTLKEYQVKGLQWMISLYNNSLNGILADEMGLGKTIQTISLVTYLIERKRNNGPFLVIVPLSTLTNWKLEFDKWAPTVRKILYKGGPPARKILQNDIRRQDFQVLLTTYEYIIKDRPVLSKIRWVHMIVDEGHRMKNAASKLSSTLTQYYHTRYRLILTGTPLQNNLPELWALLNFVLPTIFKSVTSFDEWFNTPFANTGGQDRMELTEEEQLLIIRRLHKVLRPFLLRRLKKDVEKDLPDKQERVIKCKFSALQTKLYQQLMTSNKITVSVAGGKGKGNIRGLSNMLMQLRKLCNHPFVFEQVEDELNPDKVTNDLLWRTSGKFELLDRILPKFKVTGHRVLMFFQMTQIMNIMEDFLRLRGFDYLRLDGATKSEDRSELLKLFNAPNSPYFCFLLSTRAGGLGLNLQTADTVIIYDSDWNPHQDLQAQDRAHRIGQKNEVRILRLISSNSVEEKILERARYKLDMDEKVIQAGKFDNKSTNEDREQLLRALLENADAGDVNEQEEMDDDDLNLNMSRSEEELKIFHQMDEERRRDPLYGTGKRLPRLMAENELPEIYLQDDNPVVEEVEEFVGRGARERTRVRYDDGLTEEQWLQAMDDDEDTVEDAMARKRARIEKRQVNKEKRARAVTGGESSPDQSRQTSEEPQPKKRGRKSNITKRKAEEDIIDEAPQSKKKKGGRNQKSSDILTSSERNRLQKVVNNVYEHLMNLREELPPDSDDEPGSPIHRDIIDNFIKMVPKHLYPDYYTIIKQPIAMEIIQKRINKNEYKSVREFWNDVKLLCRNAMTYNEDGSQLYSDAVLIETSASEKLKEEVARYPEFADYDADSTRGDTSIPASGVSTPLPSAQLNGTKLKITMKNRLHGALPNGDSKLSDNE